MNFKRSLCLLLLILPGVSAIHAQTTFGLRAGKDCRLGIPFNYTVTGICVEIPEYELEGYRIIVEFAFPSILNDHATAQAIYSNITPQEITIPVKTKSFYFGGRGGYKRYMNGNYINGGLYIFGDIGASIGAEKTMYEMGRRVYYNGIQSFYINEINSRYWL